MNDQHPDQRPDADPGAGSDDTHEAILERLLDLAVYAPVGVAVTLRDELPRHIKQGRQALENRVQLARFIGQLAVQTGQRELQKRIEQQRAARLAADEAAAGEAAADGAEASQALRSDEPASGPSPIASASPVEVEADTSDERDVSSDEAGVDVPVAASLPISDYESLPAINVVERLRSMSADEIEAVRRFEVAHRARRTILAKIDQLQERQADA
jgi:hypothetical protein